MTSAGDYTAKLSRKRMAAGVLFTDSVGRVLLVDPVYKDYWGLVGGCVEENEAPRQAAIRETKEELGKTISPGRLLVVDWVPPRPDRTEGVMFVYDGGLLDGQSTADIHLPTDELASWAWCDRDQIQQRMEPRLARRVTAALRAKAEGTVFDLEDGFHVL
jgi:8-oxo-dGTP pyrophosphatase MutT (NUDIX family)